MKLIDLMKKTVLVLTITISFASTVQASTLVAEESIDDQWVVGFVTDKTVHASVNGQVTHGDGLHVRLVKGHCDKGNLLTFVYTYIDNRNIGELKNKYVVTNFMGNEAILKVLFISPFLMGYRATIDMGWIGIEDLKKILESKNPITIQYVDSDEIKITDYFDILENSWSNEGVRDAIDRAVSVCNEL